MTYTGSWRFCSPQDSGREPRRRNPPGERKARYLEPVCSNLLLLNDFLARMPKGDDPHHHLIGAVDAESYIDYAGADCGSNARPSRSCHLLCPGRTNSLRMVDFT
jgi:hypothetical protein